MDFGSSPESLLVGIEESAIESLDDQIYQYDKEDWYNKRLLNMKKNISEKGIGYDFILSYIRLDTINYTNELFIFELKSSGEVSNTFYYLFFVDEETCRLFNLQSDYNSKWKVSNVKNCSIDEISSFFNNTYPIVDRTGKSESLIDEMILVRITKDKIITKPFVLIFREQLDSLNAISTRFVK